ncbi:MAG TPA: rhomboid family intramembrane serine protease [Candidatus Binataceae bacterium]|jgi:membrane associated rhomboid family serine protease|nr:rhomboid family intramembrane serine protease [Candidatus Binataceae bacterium]
MIPLRDSAGASRLSPVNLLLIAANVIVFVYEVRIGPAAADRLIALYGMTPAKVAAIGSVPLLDAGRSLLTLLAALFLHGGLLHLAGNMLYLFIFGPAVEMRFGHQRYLYFYLVAGIAGGLAMVLINPAARVPVIGASGAIAAVLGAYFVLFPRARILTIVPVFFIIEFVEVPALIYLLLWFGWQLYSGMQSRAFSSLVGGVAWWAHIGGFLFGLASAPLLARRETHAPRRTVSRIAKR